MAEKKKKVVKKKKKKKTSAASPEEMKQIDKEVKALQRGIGRPTKYEPRFCEMVITHMASGLSFESFAGLLSVTKKTLYEWTKQHPDFLNAKDVGAEKCRLFWEKLGVAGVTGQIPNFNAATWVFNMKNRFQWRDKKDDDREAKTFEPIVIDLPVAGRKIEIANKKDK